MFLRRLSFGIIAVATLGAAIIIPQHLRDRHAHAINPQHRPDLAHTLMAAEPETASPGASPGAEPPQNPGERQRPWQRDLQLTPAQMQQMQAVRDRSKATLQRQRQDLQQAQQELRRLMAGNTDRATLQQQHRQVQTLQQQLADSHFQTLLEVREILTVEQRQRLSDRLQSEREPRQRRRRGQASS